MQDIFFENFHTAMVNYPYMDFNSRNINYLSHFHEEIEIIEVVSGEVVILCESKTFYASAGDICIFMPGEVHGFSSVKDNHLYILKINCKQSVESIDFKSLRISPVVIKSNEPLNTELRLDIEQLKKEIEHQQTGYSYLVNSISNKILYQIIRCDRLHKLDSEKRKKNVTVLSVLKKSNEYIEKHYKEPISLSDIAVYCGFSKYYFAHYFHEITGQTFYVFLTLYRLEKAISELLNSDNKITDIAYNCGFSNVRSFNRTFKSTFGITPSEYKKHFVK